MTQRYPVEFVEVARQGPPGPPGQPGLPGTSAILRTAGEAIPAFHAVREDSDGKVWTLDRLDVAHLSSLVGVTRAAVAAGEIAQIVVSGILDNTALNLAPGKVWLDDGGALTQTPPPLPGVSLQLGVALSPSRFLVSIHSPYIME
jgi:hypothetical protein